jgi:hypothetical protein
MNREEILLTVEKLETETKLKAWLFQIEKKFYQVAEYGGVYRVPSTTSIWETNKRGKRLSDRPIFKIDGQNREKCINLYITSLEEKQIEEDLLKEAKLAEDQLLKEAEQLEDDLLKEAENDIE